MVLAPPHCSGEAEAGQRCGAPAWRDDPLSHPVLEKMSERELADLPMRGVAGPAPC